jgi:tRNA(Arg) A34 adenosine deaminase TadA
MMFLDRSFQDGDQTRREFMRTACHAVCASTVVAVSAPASAPATEKSREIARPGSADREHLMQRAFEMRRIAEQRGDQAYGAVIVKDGKIVGEGISRVLVRPDPTAHGEVEAIRDAARRLGTHDLGGCEIYSTAKPCPMCETACYWARISRIYYGSAITDGGAPRYASC